MILTAFYTRQTIILMELANLTTNINNVINNLSGPNAIEALQPLVFFAIGMVIYSIFIFKFYKFISRKEIFRISKGGDHSIIKKIAYVLEYLFLFPAVSFLWFLVISISLSILSEVVSISNIFLISMATLVTIRVTAYYNEDLSRDIAKLIPFGLLAVFLTDLVNLSAELLISSLFQLPYVLDNIIYYFIFIVLLEFILRLIFHGKPKLTAES